MKIIIAACKIMCLERLDSWSFIWFASSRHNVYRKHYTVCVMLRMLAVVKSTTAAPKDIPNLDLS